MTEIRLITQQLGPNLLNQINQADSICILTSFVMKSGVTIILKREGKKE
ncbi:hypothetical protein [Alkalicoccobacillus porphyridii]|nr:hypothetical protein [Alkalicoccobacillus porphyridii]